MIKMKSNLFAFIGEEEFSLEAKAALEELTANMALIIKVITNKHIFLSVIFDILYIDYFHSIASFHLPGDSQTSLTAEPL